MQSLTFRRDMNFVKRGLLLLTLSVGVLLVNETKPPGEAQAQLLDHSSATVAGDTTQAKIALSMSAGPTGVASSARIVDTDAQGNMVLLREGSNGFTCMPGNPKVVGDPPMCADAASMQWSADFKTHKPKPTNTVPGIIYMLAVVRAVDIRNVGAPAADEVVIALEASPIRRMLIRK
jgi:hypothetical protein